MEKSLGRQHHYSTLYFIFKSKFGQNFGKLFEDLEFGKNNFHVHHLGIETKPIPIKCLVPVNKANGSDSYQLWVKSVSLI